MIATTSTPQNVSPLAPRRPSLQVALSPDDRRFQRLGENHHLWRNGRFWWIAVGFFYFGWMSDLLKPTFGDESLRWAIYTGMGFYLLAAVLLIGASRTLKRDWVE